MKLFLSSEAISKAQAPAFIKLVGKKPVDIKFALIENAADVEQNPQDWLQENREAFVDIGLSISQIDLREYVEAGGLKEKLKNFDVVWLGGGNTYYLRWILHQTGADDLIRNLVNRGVVYGGGSAGAIVAGPTLDHFQFAGNSPAEAPETYLDGLNLTDVVVVPHWGSEEFGSLVQAAEQKLKASGYKTCPITDEKAVVIDGAKVTVVP